jgi:hypothetical protein
VITSVERCPRCRRNFGGTFTFRRAHVAGGCRPIRELRSIGLIRGDDGIWRRPGPTDAMQLRLPLFGRGRPRKESPSAIFLRAQRSIAPPPWALPPRRDPAPLRGQLRLFRLRASEAA